MEQYADQHLGQLTRSQHASSWQLNKTYCYKEQGFAAFLFFGAMLLLTISLAGIDVVYNYIYNYFYYAMEDYNGNALARIAIVLAVLAGFYLLLAAYQYYVSHHLGARSRAWLRNLFLKRLHRKRASAGLANLPAEIPVHDDAEVSSSIDSALSLVSSIATFFAFIYVLWQWSGDMYVHLGRFGIVSVPSYSVWVGVIYALIGTVFTFKFGRPLVLLTFDNSSSVKKSMPSTAHLGGFARQRKKFLFWVSAFYNQFSVILPLAVALPNYFNNVFIVGGLIQSLYAFDRVQEALSFIMNSYTQKPRVQTVE